MSVFDSTSLRSSGLSAPDGRLVTLRPVDERADRDLVHRWMHDPDVSAWWKLAKNPAEIAVYLERQRDLAHTMSWIAEIDGQPFAYAETYRVIDDPLATFFQAEPGDRGFHLLVGEADERGHGAPRALGLLLVMGLLRDAGVTRVLCEPDVRNARMIAWCRAIGGTVLEEVDLLEKRAAIVVWPAPKGAGGGDA